MRTVTFAFISACVIYAYPYLVYPLILRLLLLLRRRFHLSRRVSVGSITHIICAHNEAPSIRQKIGNALDAAAGRPYEIVLVCDGCTDGTAEIARRIAYEHPELKIVETSHVGKAAAQNLAVRQSRGDVLVFSDADTQLEDDTIPRLCKHLELECDCVGANVQYGQRQTPDSLYNRLEARLKALQGRLGTLIGVHGACYAVLKERYTDMDGSVLSDLALPMELLMAGRTVGFDSGARVYEHSERSNLWRSVATRRRIFCRALTTLLSKGYLRRSLGHPRLLFHLISDKMLRYFIGPISVAVIVFAGLIGGTVLVAVLALVLVTCLLALIPGQARPGSLPAKLGKASRFLLIVNLASLLALGDFLSGKSYSRW
jgi:cellulose synthase/poly-beta-1,6-N-acetylglucosamine synthase-like glycosyltransferase